MSSIPHLDPARRIVHDILDGPQEVADDTQASITTVYRWMYPKEHGGTDGMIPRRWHPKLIELAARKGRELRPQHFAGVFE